MRKSQNNKIKFNYRGIRIFWDIESYKEVDGK